MAGPWFVTDTDGTVFQMSPETQAEIRLRDAAPDLLAACVEVEGGLCDGLEGGDEKWCRLSVSYTKALLSKLRSAIAKARG